MSLISREAAIKLILSGKVGCDSLVECPEECNSMLDWAADEVAKMPSAQPEIVWCKDCERWYTEEDEDDEYGYCRNHEFWTSGIWYCADGERRDG